MANALKGKTIIVTGGARGLGRAITLGLVADGGNAVAAAHLLEDMAPLEADVAALGADGAVLPVLADIRNPADCDRIVAETTARFGSPDVLINNAGLTFTYIFDDRKVLVDQPKFWTVSDERLQAVMATNFVGGAQLTHRVVPEMIERGWGRIINVTTMIETMNRQGASPYGPSKAAMEMASEVWLHDLEGTGVTLNILNPGGAADTPGFADEAERKKFGAAQPMVDADPMAAPAVWLASDASNCVTGMRYDAAPWDPAKPPADEARRIGRPLGLVLKPKP